MNVSRAAAIATVGLTVSIAACGGSNDNPAGPTPNTPSTTLTAPTPESPINDTQLPTLRPTLTVRNAAASGSGSRTYEFQISDQSDFSAMAATQSGIAEGAGGTTSYTPAADLQASTRMFWRARVSQGGSSSPWSASAQFRTRVVGFNRSGELFDPLTASETIGARSGRTTFLDGRGLRIENASSWVRYRLASTVTSGEISVEVQGLAPNGTGQKSRIFSMMDGGSNLYTSRFLFNVQYRGANGNPDNAISYKVLMGAASLQYEPNKAARTAGVRSLNPDTWYLWTATWGSTFRLTVREGGVEGPVIYQRSESTSGTYNPSPHTVYLGANDAAWETGSYAGAVYRNLWVGNRPRPASLGSAVTSAGEAVGASR